MITKEEFEKAVECCTGFTVNCKDCPLDEKDLMCGAYFAEYLKENEPALSANSTSSEVSTNNTHNLAHLDDSTLLDICQEGLEEISKKILDYYYPQKYLAGYACAVRDNIKRLRGGDGK